VVGICASVLLVPAISMRAAPHPSHAPTFELSSLARPAPEPAPAVGPHTTWLPPERIVVEPEVVPYRPPVVPTTVPAHESVAAPARPGAAAPAADGAVPTAVPAAAASPDSSTTTVAAGTTTTMLGSVLVTLPAALTPLLPVSKGTPTPADEGPASWFHAPDGTCAHRTIPKGTVVTVTRVATGATTTCVVDDWGPSDTSRVIDLSFDTFETLASPDSGVIDVTLSW
jgi:hypothetical protein